MCLDEHWNNCIFPGIKLIDLVDIRETTNRGVLKGTSAGLDETVKEFLSETKNDYQLNWFLFYI